MVLRCKRFSHDTDEGQSMISISEKDAADEVTTVSENQSTMTDEITVDLKMDLHCVGCSKKIKKLILKFKGVDSVSVDVGKHLITIKGRMNVQELISHLRERLKRNVMETQMIPFKTDNNDKDAISNGENKDKESFERGGRDKRDKEVVGNDGGGDGDKDGGKRVEVGCASGCDGRYDSDSDYEDGDAKMELYDGYTYYIYPVESSQEYMRFMAANIMRGPQLFSDENPNAYCSIV